MSIGLLWVYARYAGRFMLEKGMLPGGLTRLDAVLAGAKEGSSGAYRDDVVVEGIGPNGQLQTRIIPKDDGGLYTDAALIQMGLERARMLPHSASSGFRSAPTQIHAAYKPISDLGRTAADAFRRGTLPRVTGLEGQPTVGELIQDAINGAKVGVASLPNPLGPPPPYRALGSLLGWLGSQIWGLFGSRPKSSQGQPYPGNLKFKGKVPPPGNTTPALFEWYAGPGQVRPAIAGTCAAGSATNQSLEAKAGSVNNVVEVETYVEMGSCGPYRYGFRVRNNLNQWSLSVLTSSVPQGNHSDTRTFDARWSGLNAVDLADPTTPLPLPDGYVPPGPEVQPLPAVPVFPSPAPSPQPNPSPEPEPQPEPDNPNPAKVPVAPPVRVPGLPGTTAPPKPGSVVVIRPDGTLPAPVPLPPGVTDPDWHFPIPGGKPIPGNGPQPKPEEVAKELGRIEQKLNTMLSPRPDNGVEWQRWLQMLFEAMFNSVQGTSYTLTEKCPPCDGSNYNPATVTINAPGAFTELGVIENRIDALAQLIDAQLGLKQVICPPCKTKLAGEGVTVHFQSHPDEVPSRERVAKQLSYRDQSGRPESFHIEHWRHFTWNTGPVMVISTGLSWGHVQVWAETAEEGVRVISHAAEAAGVNLGDPEHKWRISVTKSPRYGRIATVYPVKWDDTGEVMVSKRSGASASPTWMRDP